MDTTDAASCMESLGNPTRLDVFRLLIRAGRQGKPVGAVQESLNIPASTLSHHISHLVKCGLVSQIRDGRTLMCCANFSLMNELLAYLTAECCIEEGDCC